MFVRTPLLTSDVIIHLPMHKYWPVCVCMKRIKIISCHRMMEHSSEAQIGTFFILRLDCFECAIVYVEVDSRGIHGIHVL